MSRKTRTLRYALLAASAMAAAGAARADDATTTVKEVVVTGSAIPTTPGSVVVPVTIVNPDVIAKTGVDTNVLEILRKDVPGFAGRSNTGNSNANNTNQNTAGGSQIQLRNLDTLVLIDGRRAAIDAIAGVGGKAFVNVADIPPAAIGRIEVLTDGSSAIYGSDAVGGVINLILKDNYNGVEIGGRHATASGDYTESSGYILAGHDFAPGVNLTVTGSWSENSPLFQKARSFSSPFHVSSAAVPGVIGSDILASNLNSPSQVNPTGLLATAPNLAALVTNGTYLASSAAAIGQTYDLSQFQTLLLKQQQKAVSAKFRADLLGGGRLQFFTDFQLAHNNSWTRFLPRVTSVTVPQNAPYNPIAGSIGGVQFGDTALPKQFYNTDDFLRVVAGLKGQFDFLNHNWRWEAAYDHSEDKLQQLQTNLIYKPNLALAIAGGYDSAGNPLLGGAYSKVFTGFSTSGALALQPALDPFARTLNPAAIANLYGTERINAYSQLDSFDGKLTGALFKLPAGDVAIALGAAFRREALEGHADANGANFTGPSPQNWIGGQFFDPFGHSRTIASEFAEVRVPITAPGFNAPGLYSLDLTGALRHEHYSDAGDSTVPKVGFRWEPFDDEFVLRGSYSRSFTAPTLFAEYGPTDTRIAGTAIITQAFGLPNSGFTVEDGNNPALKPAHAETYYLGFVVRPHALPDFQLSVDYSAVDYWGIPGGIGFVNILQDVNLRGSASQFFHNLSMNALPGQPGATYFSTPGQVFTFLSNPANDTNIFAVDRFTNLGGAKVRSLTVNGDYVWRTDHMGAVRFDSTAAIFPTYKFQSLPTQLFYEYAGASTNGGTGPQGTLPKFRVYSVVDWTVSDWDMTLANTYIDRVTDESTGGIVYFTNLAAGKVHPYPVSSYTSWDVRVAKTFATSGVPLLKSWQLAVGVDDIFNAMPPRSPNAWTDNNVDVSTYSPIGRLAYATLKADFF
jgi:iron complex outermembrane receptor protein